MTITDHEIGRGALALDRLLADPDGLAGLAARARRGAPVGLLDQLDAATARTRAALDRMGPLLGGRTEGVTRTNVPAWVRLGLATVYARWVAGAASTCLHAPHPDRPEPVISAAWRPDLVACSRCPHLFVLRPGSAAERRCDGCGHVTEGVECDGGIRPLVLAYGPLSYLAGTCSSCDC